MRLRMKDFNIKDLLDGKLSAKLFHKVTSNRIAYEIVYCAMFSKLFKNY